MRYHLVPETAQAIADLPEVTEVYSVAGDFDLVVMIRMPNHDDWRES
jgi:DNA-binding Lrp family transcriptional regulator